MDFFPSVHGKLGDHAKKHATLPAWSGVVNQLSQVSTPAAYGTRPAVDNAALDSTSDKTCGPGQQFL